MLKNLKIGYKLTLLIAVLIAFIICVGYVAMRTINEADAALAEIYYDRVESLGQLKEVSDGYGNDIIDTIHKVRQKNMTFEQG